MRPLSMSEVFGPTIQGEGPSQGRAVVFVRFGLCNLDCSWCDTPYTWDWHGQNGVIYDRETQLTSRSIQDVAEEVRRRAGASVRRVVVSGGEPLVQRSGLVELAHLLAIEGFRIEVETNGTLSPASVPEWVDFNVSPKLAGSGVDLGRRFHETVLREFVERGAAFKYVVTGADDFAEMCWQVDRLDVPPDRVWIMPEGITAAAILPKLAAAITLAAERGWNVSPRLHVLAFDNQRGV